ncbi:MAG: ScpA family protein [Xanthomonadales bacterium]|nr:ScpA family protein [Xanthomonadales bacterium]
MTEHTEHPEQEVPQSQARQSEMPFAIVQGQPLTQLPQDLYIPPDALEVILEAFEGPLDLLLYLIRRQNLDILDIPIAEITRQYIEYIEMLRDLQFELAAEYLVMAAILAEIKSRLLLPRPGGDDDDEEDPRAELVRRLQEYERFKLAAENLDELPREDRDFSVAHAWVEDRSVTRTPPEVDLRELLLALKDVMGRAELFSHHHIQVEPLSVRERMTSIVQLLEADVFVPFHALFTLEEGRRGVVVSFLALMELCREQLVDIVQNEPMAPIYVRAASSSTEVTQDDD